MRKAIIKTWVIGIIILIISAAILIYFATKLAHLGIDKREACRQSVVLRSKSIAGLHPGEALPLNCQTEIIKIKTSDEEEIKKIISEALYDCWYMMGEGELDFIGESGEKSCVICSIIKFDEKIKGKNISGLYKYMRETIIPGKNITFADYIMKREESEIHMENDTLKIDKDYAIVFLIVSSPTLGETIIKSLIGVGYGGIIGKIFSQVIAKLSVAGLIVGAIPSIADYIQTWIKCKGHNMCTALMFIPYNATALSQSCQIILSIPPEE
ncbi:MAG: hypothetical protein QXM27_01155 [Candidatus Pacearchaeota archaeon]